MAEAHGNHKQREDEFFSCQVIQNSLLDCTVTAIPVNSASAHLRPKSTEGFYSLTLPFPISLLPVQPVLTKTSLHGDELPGSHPGEPTILANFGCSIIPSAASPHNLELVMLWWQERWGWHSVIVPTHCERREEGKTKFPETLWKSVHVPLLNCGYFIHFCAAAADCKPYSGSRVCFLLQPFQMTNSCPQPLSTSYKPETNPGPSQPSHLSLIYLRYDKDSKNTFSGEYEIRAVALLTKKIKIKKSKIISQTIFRARTFESGQIYTHNTAHCWEG